MNSLKEWKRCLLIGVQIRQVWQFQKGNVDSILTITGVQTKAVYGTIPGIERRCWLEFPKRQNIEFTEKGWRILDGTQRIAEYEWVTEENEIENIYNTQTKMMADRQIQESEDGRTYARDHLFLDDGQRKNAGEWHANAKRLRGQEWKAYFESFIEAAAVKEAARRERGNPQFPEVNPKSIQIHPSVVDEWYGIEVFFAWTDQPLPQDRLRRHLQAVIPGHDVEGYALLCHVFQDIQASVAWSDFYREPQRVWCDMNGSDETPREVTIPRFTTLDECGDWSFNVNGGSFAIDTR